MLEGGDRKVVVKRMFSIIVEGLQNIRLHGEKDNEGDQTSFFLLLKNDEHYFIYLGNLVLKMNFYDLLVYMRESSHEVLGWINQF